MALELTGQVGIQSKGNGVSGPIRLGNQGEAITGEMSGKHFEQVLAELLPLQCRLASALAFGHNRRPSHGHQSERFG